MASLVFFQEWQDLAPANQKMTAAALATLCVGVAVIAMKPTEEEGDKPEEADGTSTADGTARGTQLMKVNKSKRLAV